MGVQTEPPVRNFSEYNRLTGLSNSQMAQKLLNEARSLCFVAAGKPGMQEIVWDTVLVGGALLVEVPHNIKPEGSKERLDIFF